MKNQSTGKPTIQEIRSAKFEQTSSAAAATIAAELKARLDKTKRLRAAREAAGRRAEEQLGGVPQIR